MQRALLWLLLAFLGGLAIAQQNSVGDAHPPAVELYLPPFLHGISLSEQQSYEIQGLLESSRSDPTFQGEYEVERYLRIAVLKQSLSDQFDVEQINSMLDEAAELRRSLDLQHIALMHKIYALLTSDQREIVQIQLEKGIPFTHMPLPPP